MILEGWYMRKMKNNIKSTNSIFVHISVQSLGSPLASYVTLDTLFNFSPSYARSLWDNIFWFCFHNCQCHGKGGDDGDDDDEAEDDDDVNDVYLKVLLNLTSLREFIFHSLYILYKYYANLLCKHLASMHQLPNSNKINQ